MHFDPLSYFPSMFPCKACQEHIFSSSDPELFEPEPIVHIDQKIKLFVLPLFACLLIASYYTYRSCFLAKEVEPVLDQTEEQAELIGSTSSRVPSPLSLEKQHPKNGDLDPLILDQVIQRAENMRLLFPRLTNRLLTAIDQIKELYSEDEVLHAFQNTRMLIHPSIINLMIGFLQYKLKFGSEVEKKLYSSISQEDFIVRLITKRPLVFSGKSDVYQLRDGSTGRFGKFELVGTDQEKQIHLEDYLSYDEMEIAALIGLSTPSHFINKGEPLNEGSISFADDHEKTGISIALVGARLEREGYMEYQYIMVTRNQNTLENGYGPLPEDENQDTAKQAKMRLFKKFYDVDYFPTYEEVCANNQHYVKCSVGFISEPLYKHRIKIVIENFLVNANTKGADYSQDIYAQPYGWGLNNWKQDEVQRQWFIEVFLEAIQNGDYPFISDVDFSCIMKYQNETRSLKKFHELDGQKVNAITLHFPHSKQCRQLCEKLPPAHMNKRLANSYGWNANSYCGNEYWNGQLTASSGAIMMCASPLQVLAVMPEINPCLTQNLFKISKSTGF